MHPVGQHVYELLVIGGRSGVGKSSVGFEIAAQLESADIAHAYLEGDCMDWVYPKKPGLAEKNLSAIWQNYAAAGYRRLIYTNTASVGSAGHITGAMGGPTRVVGALLTSATVRRGRDSPPGRSAARWIRHPTAATSWAGNTPS